MRGTDISYDRKTPERESFNFLPHMSLIFAHTLTVESVSKCEALIDRQIIPCHGPCTSASEIKLPRESHLNKYRYEVVH